jgi:hypothetical protein
MTIFTLLSILNLTNDKVAAFARRCFLNKLLSLKLLRGKLPWAAPGQD